GDLGRGVLGVGLGFGLGLREGCEQLVRFGLGRCELGDRKQLLANRAVVDDLHAEFDDVIGVALGLGDLLDQPGDLDAVDLAVVGVDPADAIAGLGVALDLFVEEAGPAIEPLLALGRGRAARKPA